MPRFILKHPLVVIVVAMALASGTAGYAQTATTTASPTINANTSPITRAPDGSIVDCATNGLNAGCGNSNVPTVSGSTSGNNSGSIGSNPANSHANPGIATTPGVGTAVINNGVSTNPGISGTTGTVGGAGTVSR